MTSLCPILVNSLESLFSWIYFLLKFAEGLGPRQLHLPFRSGHRGGWKVPSREQEYGFPQDLKQRQIFQVQILRELQATQDLLEVDQAVKTHGLEHCFYLWDMSPPIAFL